MSGVILAILEHPEAAAHILAAAQRLGDLIGGSHVNVLAVRMPPIAAILVSEEVLTHRREARIRAHEQARVGALKAAYDAWVAAAPAGWDSQWIDLEGSADAAVAEWGRRADFLVLRRPGPHQSDAERQALHAALFETDRPALVIPPEHPPGAFGRRVALAWRDDARTIKAVLAALRCLARAERIYVLAGVRADAAPPQLPEVLAEHGYQAELHLLPLGGPVFGEALLAKARALGADLLVLGAYAHHPIRGLILGGVTRHMLAHADLPVLMRH